MIRSIFLSLSVLISLHALAINPKYSLKASGAVYSVIVENNTLYAATDAGCIDVFNWKNKKKINSIHFPMIKDFMGDEMPPKIYSIDKWPKQEKLIVISQGKHGFRNAFIINGKKQEQIFSAEKDKMMIKKALFIEENKILIATLGNEIMLYDLKTKSFLYKKQFGTSVFSDIDINNEKTLAAATDESGNIHIIDIITGAKIKDLRGENLDNIYQVVFNDQKIIGAGQDRRASIYSANSSNCYYLKSPFIIYSVGLSKDGKWGAYSYGEENFIRVFNTSTKIEKAMLKGQKSTLTQIKFVQNNYIITASEDELIMVWQLNE